MKDKLENYLFEIIGQEIILNKINKKNISKIIGRYDLYSGKINGEDYTFLLQNDNYVVISRLLNNLIILNEEKFNNPVYVIENMTNEQRKRLIANNIAFIDPNRQLYIPYMLLRIDEIVEKIKRDEIIKFTPACQLVFISIMLQETDIVNPNIIKKQTKLSRITINRCIRDMINLNLIIESGKNTRKSYNRCDIKDFWNIGKQYMISPVRKTYLIDYLPSDLPLFNSSQSIFYKLTFENESTIETYAIAKEFQNIIESYAIKEDGLIEEGKKVYQIQVWNYDPSIFGDNDKNVDIFSLYSLLKNNDSINVDVKQLFDM